MNRNFNEFAILRASNNLPWVIARIWSQQDLRQLAVYARDYYESKKLREADGEVEKSLFNAYCTMIVFYTFSTLGVLLIAALLVPVHVFSWLILGEPVNIPLLFCVALISASGALFSTLIRLYNVNSKSLAESLKIIASGQIKRNNLIVYCSIRPITGIIAGIIFTFMMASGLLSGDVFAKFDCGINNNCGDDINKLMYYSPIEATDYFKCFVWAFFAGFSERLLPDVLAKLDAKK